MYFKSSLIIINSIYPINIPNRVGRIWRRLHPIMPRWKVGLPGHTKLTSIGRNLILWRSDAMRSRHTRLTLSGLILSFHYSRSHTADKPPSEGCNRLSSQSSYRRWKHLHLRRRRRRYPIISSTRAWLHLRRITERTIFLPWYELDERQRCQDC